MSIPIYVVVILLIWLIINVFYKLFIKLFKAKTLKVDLKYGVLLIVKKQCSGRPSSAKRKRKVYLYVYTAIYFFALASALFTLALMVYVGLFEKARGTVILVPGLNITGEDLLYFLMAAFTGILLHEYFHAKIALKAGIPVKAYGIILAFIIPAAFVEIDEESFEQVDKSSKVAVLAAGIAVNMIVAALSLAILSYIASPSGFTIVDVYENSLADRSRLKPYDVIYKANNTDITLEILNRYLARNESLVLVFEVFRPGIGYLNLTIIKKPLENKLGILVYPHAPSKNIISTVNSGIFIVLHKLLSWIHVVNFSLTILNSLPMFVTDGGRIFKELLGEELSKVINVSTLVFLLIALVVSARV